MDRISWLGPRFIRAGKQGELGIRPFPGAVREKLATFEEGGEDLLYMWEKFGTDFIFRLLLRSRGVGVEER